MNEYLLIKLLHILCFVYWLGGDLGTFYASRFVVKPELSVESRSTALTIMMGCDQGPRFAMPLILPLGIQLAAMQGSLNIDALWLNLSWFLCLAWVTMVVVLHFSHGKSFIPALTQFDFYFRGLMVAGLAMLSLLSLFGDGFLGADWVAIKLLVFAALVACGLMIRVNLKPFLIAWGQTLTAGPNKESDQVLIQALGRCRPFVYTIWVGLLVNAAYGLHLL
jgi:hypothetical protein